MKNTNPRIAELGRAYAGSQLQVQIYVNQRAGELSQKIIQGLPSLASLGPHLRWVSPLEKDKFAEYQDNAFLKACGFEHFSFDLRKFWPRGGPVWDALDSVEYGEVNTKKSPTCRGQKPSTGNIRQWLPGLVKIEKENGVISAIAKALGRNKRGTEIRGFPLLQPVLVCRVNRQAD